MKTPSELFSRLRAVFSKPALDGDFNEELAQHLEAATEDNIRSGMAPEEAARRARIALGGVEQARELHRDARGLPWLEDLARDVRFALRALRKNPVFTVVVVLTLGLGIGASTAVFTVINALLLRPLPIDEPGQLVLLEATGSVGNNPYTLPFPYPLFDRAGHNKTFPYPFFELFSDRARSLSDVVAVSGWRTERPMVAAGFGATESESVTAEEVSGNYFAALGVSAALGRTIKREDDQPANTEPVAVVSHEFWQHRFNSDPAVIGKTVRIDNVTVTIVGVMPRGFCGVQVGTRTDLWFPVQLSLLLDGNMPWGREALKTETTPWIHILGRLRPGVSPTQAATELDALFQTKLGELDPRRKTPTGSPERSGLLEQKLAVVPAGTGYAGARAAFLQPAEVLMILVGIMQLVVCANVAGLLLARGAAREREFALRSALGASRRRLIRQLLTESLLLAAVAGVLGLLLAGVTTRLLTGAVGDLELGTDRRVLLFSLTTTVISGVFFGAVPALRLSRREMAAGMKNPGAGRSRWNGALVVTQIAFAFVLIAAAGLFVRTFRNLASVETGFQRQHRQLFDLHIAPECPPLQRAPHYRRLAEAMEVLPGVESVTYYQGLDLLGDTAYVLDFSVADYVPAGGEDLTASLVLVGPRFFETMGIPLSRGRDFGLRDALVMSNNLPAIVISEWSSHRLFGNADPIGKRIKLVGQDFDVVGVARDVKYGQLREAPRFVFYQPVAVSPNALRVTFAVKTTANPPALAGGLRSAVRQVDAGAQISGLRTIDETLTRALNGERRTAQLAGFFGALALLLSGMGLFGLMAYQVSHRTREIGIRMALGAPVGTILRLVVRYGLVLGLLGCAAGLAAAAACTRFIASLLYGVTGVDGPTFAGTAVLLLTVALVACLLPARRAAKVDPIIALRAE